ncbi:MAG: FHA domain-containing protein [Spirochaetales bacterium]|nr:FHA domain-containing protein [Spirochaetales bacterium]
MNEITLDFQSNLGQRLQKIRKPERRCLRLNDKSVPLTAKITIGRDSMNDIVLEDNLISRYHAIIQKIKKAYFIKDLNSTNGTSVNGNRIPREKYIRIFQHDVIQLGRTDLSFL